MNANKSISEVDAMALAGIYSSQLLNFQFIENRPDVLTQSNSPTHTIIDKRNA